MDTLTEKVKNTIETNSLIKEGDHILLGVSGGPDSVCLFNVLDELSKSMDFTIGVVHVNHSIRPVTAERDQTFVEDMCRDRNIPFQSFVIDCRKMAEEEKLTLEVAARKARYNAFYESAASRIEEGRPIGKIRIAVAHNANDQSETALFRIIRGTGIDGLSAMDYMRRNDDGFILIRPLLDASREEIENYIEEHGLETCLDETNLEKEYTRNRIRLDLIPYIEENFNPNVQESLRRLCDNARDDKAYLKKMTNEVFKEVCISTEDGVCTMSKDLLAAQEKAIRHRLILKAFESIGLEKDVYYSHLATADRLLESETTSAQVDFPQGYVFRISYNKAECFSGKAEPVKPGVSTLKTAILYIEDYVRGENQAIFDIDKMVDVYDFAGGPLAMLIARTREPGDFIKLKVGTKTIQDLFVDMKIPRSLRDTIYMAAIGNEILWIPEGVARARYSDRFKVTETTKRVLVLEMQAEL